VPTARGGDDRVRSERGVLGKTVDGNNAIEENVAVDLYTVLSGQKDAKAFSTPTTRAGDQFNVNPSAIHPARFS
jgi:hypothetical protein